jgi:hypothetical protein
VGLWSDPIEQQLEISEYLGDRIAVSVCNRSNFLSSPSMFVSESSKITRVPFYCKFALDAGTYGIGVRSCCLRALKKRK